MNNELKHHGVLGMKWGIRRYQPYSTVPRKSGKGGKEIGEAKEGSRKVSNRVSEYAPEAANRYINSANIYGEKANKFYSKAEKAYYSGNQKRYDKYLSKGSEYLNKTKVFEKRLDALESLNDEELKKVGEAFVKKLYESDISFAARVGSMDGYLSKKADENIRNKTAELMETTKKKGRQVVEKINKGNLNLSNDEISLLKSYYYQTANLNLNGDVSKSELDKIAKAVGIWQETQDKNRL